MGDLCGLMRNEFGDRLRVQAMHERTLRTDLIRKEQKAHSPLTDQIEVLLLEGLALKEIVQRVQQTELPGLTFVIDDGLCHCVRLILKKSNQLNTSYFKAGRRKKSYWSIKCRCRSTMIIRLRSMIINHHSPLKVNQVELNGFNEANPQTRVLAVRFASGACVLALATRHYKSERLISRLHQS